MWTSSGRRSIPGEFPDSDYDDDDWSFRPGDERGYGRSSRGRGSDSRSDSHRHRGRRRWRRSAERRSDHQSKSNSDSDLNRFNPKHTFETFVNSDQLGDGKPRVPNKLRKKSLSRRSSSISAGYGTDESSGNATSARGRSCARATARAVPVGRGGTTYMSGARDGGAGAQTGGGGTRATASSNNAIPSKLVPETTSRTADPTGSAQKPSSIFNKAKKVFTNSIASGTASATPSSATSATTATNGPALPPASSASATTAAHVPPVAPMSTSRGVGTALGTASAATHYLGPKRSETKKRGSVWDTLPEASLCALGKKSMMKKQEQLAAEWRSKMSSTGGYGFPPSQFGATQQPGSTIGGMPITPELLNAYRNGPGASGHSTGFPRPGQAQRSFAAGGGSSANPATLEALLAQLGAAGQSTGLRPPQSFGSSSAGGGRSDPATLDGLRRRFGQQGARARMGFPGRVQFAGL